MNAVGRRPAVFLDRDGTLNREVEGALARVEDLELLEGAAEGAAHLAEAGFALVIVSNQSAVARGWASVDQVDAVNRALVQRLTAAGAAPDGVFVCPHHPSQGAPPYRRHCPCRKPAPGLIQRAARELDLDLARSWVVGDAARDLEAGQSLGLRGILVLTGKGTVERDRLAREGREPQLVATDLGAAARQVIESQGR